MNKEIVMLGKSPFINEVRDELPELISIIDCVGINGIIKAFPQISHCAFIDSRTIGAVCPYWKDQTLITTKNVGKMIRAMNYKQPNLETYGIERNKIFPTQEFSKNLGYSSYTFTFALSWCLRKGYKTVYLCGIDFYSEVGYYNDTNYRNSKPCTHSEKVHFSKEFLWRMAGLINIIDLNPKCYSNLSYKPITKLIKERSLAASLRPVKYNLDTNTSRQNLTSLKIDSERSELNE